MGQAKQKHIKRQRVKQLCPRCQGPLLRCRGCQGEGTLTAYNSMKRLREQGYN